MATTRSTPRLFGSGGCNARVDEGPRKQNGGLNGCDDPVFGYRLKGRMPKRRRIGRAMYMTTAVKHAAAPRSSVARVSALDWNGISQDLDDQGSAVLASLLTPEECKG